MAPSSATRRAKALSTGRARKARASKEHEEAAPPSDGEEDGGTQANQAEEEEEVEKVKDKLGRLMDPKADRDQSSREFLSDIANDKNRITATLDEAKAAIGRQKATEEEQLLQLLGNALAPASGVLGGDPRVYTVPLPVPHIIGEGTYLHNEMARVLEASRSLLQEYEALNHIETHGSFVDDAVAEYNNAYNSVEAIFEAGRKVNKRAIENMLADKYNEVRNDTQISVEDKKKALLTMPAEREDEDLTMENHEGWGSIAEKSCEAAAYLVVEMREIEA